MGTEDNHGVNVIVTITILAGMITIGSTLIGKLIGEVGNSG